MPDHLNVDGYPLWLQMMVGVAVILTTILAAISGYSKKLEREPPGAAQTLVAAFPDMTTFRQLTDQTRVLCERIDWLISSLNDHTHYLRDKIDVDREVCMRLRELKEEIIRSDKQRALRVPRSPRS